MAERPFTQADLDVLAQWDTPTICNGLEVVAPERRRFGYTVEPMVCIDPKAKPEKQQKNITKAVTKLLKNYPPKKK